MHISIIDDETILVERIMKKLSHQGYAVSGFFGHKDYMDHGSHDSQLYIIDISLRDGSGFDIIKYLRTSKKSKAPIIIVSGYSDSEKIIYGLDLGADDFLVKPIVPEVLIARIQAVLRRPTNYLESKVLRFKDIVFDTHSKITTVNKIVIRLTKKESLILETFLTSIGRVVSRERLISEAWGGDSLFDITDNTINVTLSTLRKKLPGQFVPRTVYNFGYILE
jgi:DNA-binding response OmpR family regulator